MVFYTVYKITHIDSGKFYIGKHQTCDLEDKYFGSGKHLKRAVNKYGREAFKREILFVFETEEEMNAKERELVTTDFCNRTDTYNICEGGQGGFGFINRAGLNGTRKGVEAHAAKRVSDPEWYAEWKRRAAKGVTERNQSPETKQKRVATIRERHEVWPGWKGEKHTEETRAILSQKAKQRLEENGNPMSDRAWVSNGEGAKLVLKAELAEHLTMGFVPGKTGFERARKQSESAVAKEQAKGSKLDELKEEMAGLYERYALGESLRTIAADLPYSYRALQVRFQKCGFDTSRKG